MQTFLPYPDFYMSALVLDRARLGKQRIETKQIIQTLIGESAGWKNHPAVLMWKDHVDSLCYYGMVICSEWIRRGYKDNQLDWFKQCKAFVTGVERYPNWFGDEKFHASHRSNLLRKMPEHYNQFGWKETNDLPYIWPKV